MCKRQVPAIAGPAVPVPTPLHIHTELSLVGIDTICSVLFTAFLILIVAKMQRKLSNTKSGCKHLLKFNIILRPFFSSCIAAEGPELLQRPVDLRVNEGSTVTFTCQFRGDPAPTVTWYYNSSSTALANTSQTSIATTTNVVSSLNSFSTTSTLTLPSVTNQARQGNYSCRASNTHSSHSATATLRVFGKNCRGVFNMVLVVLQFLFFFLLICYCLFYWSHSPFSVWSSVLQSCLLPGLDSSSANFHFCTAPLIFFHHKMDEGFHQQQPKQQ